MAHKKVQIDLDLNLTNQIELEIKHGVNELRCGQELIRQQLEHISEMIEALGSGASQEVVDRIKAITAARIERTAALQAVIDSNQPEPPNT